MSSDRAGCDEAIGFLDGVETAAVKEGYGRYMVACLHPFEADQLIEHAAERGLRKLGEVKPWDPGSPTLVRIEFNRSEEADSAAKGVGVRRLDAYTLEFAGTGPLEAHQAARQMIAMAGLGAQANQ